MTGNSAHVWLAVPSPRVDGAVDTPTAWARCHASTRPVDIVRMLAVMRVACQRHIASFGQASVPAWQAVKTTARVGWLRGTPVA